jgi:L-malate glycosyltransferase
MNIAIILPSLEKKGPIIYCQYLVNGLIDKGENVEIFYFKDLVEVDMQVKVTQINFFGSYDFSKFDIIHTHCAVPDLFAFKNKFQKKWLTTPHSMFKEQTFLTHNLFRAWLIVIVWKLALRKVRYIAVFSNVLKDYYIQKLRNKEIFIIPTGVPELVPKIVSSSDRELLEKLKTNFILIGASGLLIKRKGFKQLIDFLALNNNFAVVITGDGQEKESLIRYAKELKVDDRFILLGFKDNAIDYYQYYDVYVLPSYAEGLPLSLLEAMSQSLPIVCSNLSIYQDYFSSDDVSFFEVKNLESLKNAILLAIEKKLLYKSASYKLYKSKFSIVAMATRYITLYNKILIDVEKTPNIK